MVMPTKLKAAIDITDENRNKYSQNKSYRSKPIIKKFNKTEVLINSSNVIYFLLNIPLSSEYDAR